MHSFILTILYKNGGRDIESKFLPQFLCKGMKAKLKDWGFLVFPTIPLFLYCNILCKDILKYCKNTMIFCLVFYYLFIYLFRVTISVMLLSGSVILGYVAYFKLNLKPWRNPIKGIKII